MARESRSGGENTFADFMYAVVVGVAFSEVRLNIGPSAVLATFFLLVVVIEDYYMYQTTLRPHKEALSLTSPASLFFEMGILLSWYLAFVERAVDPGKSFAFLAAFFFLKWIASARHLVLSSTAKAWMIHRDHCFLVGCALAVLFSWWRGFPSVVVGGYTFGFDWIIVPIVWTLQTSLWWWITLRFENRTSA